MRFGCKGAGKADALLHAAGKLVRITRRPLVQPDEFKLLAHSFLAFGVRHAGKFQTEADVFFHRAPWQQGELLEHHRHIALPQLAQVRCAARGDIGGAPANRYLDLAARHLVEAVDGTKQR